MREIASRVITIHEGPNDIPADSPYNSIRPLDVARQKRRKLSSSRKRKLSTELISIDEMAATLGVKRRRIYDIVNVLEGLSIVTRVHHSHYTWNGEDGVAKALADLTVKFGPQSSTDSCTAQPEPSEVRVSYCCTRL